MKSIKAIQSHPVGTQRSEKSNPFSALIFSTLKEKNKMAVKVCSQSL